MNKPNLLIVEDDDLQYELYQEALEGKYTITRVTTGGDALRLISKAQPVVVILDHVLDEGDQGLQLLPELKELVPHVPVIMVSGAMEVQQRFEALQGPRRAHYCLNKPVDLVQLQRTIETALKECGEAEILKQYESLERSRRVDAEVLFSRSTDRLSRQTEIRKRVADSEDRPNVSALAREFKVARRTIIRDLQELIRRGEIRPEVFPRWEEEDGGE